MYLFTRSRLTGSLYQYESLLKQTVGIDKGGYLLVCNANQPAVCHNGYFYTNLPDSLCHDCIGSYIFVFTDLGRSTFHLFPPSFDQNPVNVDYGTGFRRSPLTGDGT